MNGLPNRFESGSLLGSNFDIYERWQYRTAPAGEREQKRQWWIDGTVESGQNYFWQYYQLAGTRQHAVWHGVQRLSDECNFSGLTERNVWMYPAEYLSYGLSDVAAVSENPTHGKTYYIHDHLGSVRLAINKVGSVAIVKNSIEYEPFGEVVTDYAATGPAPRLGWIGKERDAETGHGNFGVRNYDFEGGRFLSGDALWEDYRSLSVYQYGANSPTQVIDPTGLFLDFRQISTVNPFGSDLLINALSTKTGLNLSIDEDTGYLAYERDEDGNPVVNSSEDTSPTARKLLTDAIDSDTEIQVHNSRQGSKLQGDAKEGYVLGMDFDQIKTFVKGTSNMDHTVMGTALVFLHEVDHSAIGTGMKDERGFGNTGGPVDTINKIREELGMPLRLSYTPRNINLQYIPFDQTSLKALRANRLPPRDSKYIVFEKTW